MCCSLLEIEVLSHKKAHVIENLRFFNNNDFYCWTIKSVFHKSVYLQLWILEPWKYRMIFLSGNTKIRANRRLHLIFYPAFLHQKTIQSWHLSFEHSLELRLLLLCDPDRQGNNDKRSAGFLPRLHGTSLWQTCTSSQSLKMGIMQ